MESFEPGIRCPYTLHTFSVNEYGMKCSCGRVLTLSAWQEKQRCFCGRTSLVRAIATPVLIIGDQPPPPPPPFPPEPVDPPSTDNFSLSGCGCFALLFLFIVIAFGMYASQSNQQPDTEAPQPQRSNHSQDNTAQNYPGWNFPKAECGDSNPPGLQNFYPVFVNRTDSNTLSYLKNNYCRDAYLKIRKSVNRQAIQVASFRSQKRAIEFFQIMMRDPTISNSAEIGSPSLR